jgi:hypothetical protein
MNKTIAILLITIILAIAKIIKAKIPNTIQRMIASLTKRIKLIKY